jgi:hypothetical protein
MRNDARPIGEDSSLKSGDGPHGGGSPLEGERPDGGEDVEREHRSHVVNREAEQHQPGSAEDPVMPRSGAAHDTKI